MAGTGRIGIVSITPVGIYQYDVSIRFDIAFNYGGWNENPCPYEISCDGQKVSGTASFSVPSGGGNWVWYNIGGTRTFRVDMPWDGANKTINMSARITTGVSPSVITASLNHGLSGRPYTFTVSYNANGGTGAPGAQSKIFNKNLTLSSARPTRTGYTFMGWSTSANGSVSYNPGSTYSANSNATLYAVWDPLIYTVSYNANGGTGAPGAQSKTYGLNITLSTTRPSRSGYNFLGWGTSAGSTSVAYNPGSTYSANANTTLYAIWTIAYAKPRIVNIITERCDSAGTITDEGTYGKVSFSWATDGAVTSIKIEHRALPSGSFITNYVTASGTSGNVSQIIGSNALSIETTYEVRITVADAQGSTVIYQNIAPIPYVMDFLAGGKGVAFGKPAELNMAIDSQWPLKIRSGLTIDGNASVGGTLSVSSSASVDGTLTAKGAVSASQTLSVAGTTTMTGAAYLKSYLYDRFGYPMENGLATYTSAGIDPNTTLYETILTHHANGPVRGQYYYIRTIWYSTKSATANRAQYAMPYANNGSMYHRYYYGGWTTWRRHANADEFDDYLKTLTGISVEAIEIFDVNPYVDFHKNRSTTGDYTGRIINWISEDNLMAYPGISSTSDQRLKKDVVELDDIYVDVIREIRPVLYRYTRYPNAIRSGFIAQDFTNAFEKYGIEDIPIVGKDGENFYVLDYNQIEALLLKGWQQHDEKISELEQKVETLESEVELLKQELATLKEKVK